MLGTLLAGRYKIIKSLGEGGFGEAYLAEDQHLPDAQCCVVKKLKTEHHQAAALKVARRLFDAEAKMLHKLGHHDQIPRLLAHFEEAEGFYLVEEFVPGHGIDEELEPGQPMKEEDAIALLYDILEVLDFVHQNQVIHRDIKPSNLIRRQTDGKVVLIDFGAVKQMTTQLINNHSHTPQTVLIGSPGYVPSEQFRGNPKLSSDVYAVGMIGIQALTGINPGMGQLPEDDETGELVWRNHAEVSPEFATILEKMVLYDYRQRYGSASTALAAVQALIDARKAAGLPQADVVLIDDFAKTEMGAVEEVPATVVTTPPAAPTDFGPAPTAIPPRPEAVEPVAASSLETPPLPETAAQDSTRYQDNENFKNVPVEPVTAATIAATPPPLPKSLRASKGSKKLKAAALGIVVLLLGGGALGLASPHLEPLCQVFNNCSRNLQFQTVYKDAVDDAETAQANSKQAKNLKDLEAAHDRFEDAIASFKSIPEDVKIYPTAKQELPEYEKQFKVVQARLVAEKKAQEALEQAEATAKAAEAKTAEAEKATTVAPIAEVQKQWKTAQTQLKSIPEDSFVAAQAKEKQQSQEKEIQALQSKIDQLIAAEKERQRQAAVAAAAARKKQQAAAAAQRAATRSTASSSSTTSRTTTPSRSTSSTPSRSTSSPTRSTPPSAPKAAPKKEPLWGAPAGKEPLW
ncbi:MAG: protein kinase [Cyanobacteria bacterium P01_A01_bin.17]